MWVYDTSSILGLCYRHVLINGSFVMELLLDDVAKFYFMMINTTNIKKIKADHGEKLMVEMCDIIGT
jgi:hypothetical protein